MTRQWQTEIVLNIEPERSTLIYGDTVADLSATTRQWLLDHRPDQFENRVRAVLQGSTLMYLKRGSDTATWCRLSAGRIDEDIAHDFIDAVDTFIDYALMPEPGPDFQDILVINGVLQHQLVRTIRREKDADWANHWLWSGWRLITIETAPKQPTTFVLGHPEEIKPIH